MKNFKLYAGIVAFVLLSRLIPLPQPMLPPVKLLAQATGSLNWFTMHGTRLGADFTDANASGLQTIPGLTFYLPSNQALTYQIDCDLSYSQATVVADAFGIQFATTAPTATGIGGIVATNATTFASSLPAAQTTTTATNVVVFTPAVTTVMYGHLGGSVENPSAAADNTTNIMVSQSTAANVVVIKRDSVCRWWALQ